MIEKGILKGKGSGVISSSKELESIIADKGYKPFISKEDPIILRFRKLK